MDKHTVLIEVTHRSNEEAYANHCFVTGTSRRRAPHEPTGDVRCRVLVSMREGGSVDVAARSPYFVASDRVFPKVSFPFISPATYAQPEVDRLPLRLSVD